MFKHLQLDSLSTRTYQDKSWNKDRLKLPLSFCSFSVSTNYRQLVAMLFKDGARACVAQALIWTNRVGYNVIILTAW